MTDDDPRRFAPAAARNREPIFDVLRRFVAPKDLVLEIASGSGEHGLYLAPKLGVTWQPSDPDPDARASIDAHVRASGGINAVRPALDLDVTAPDWPELPSPSPPNLIVCINMIHIAPWAACEGLLDHAMKLASPKLYLYGPYKRGGQHTAPSNEAFDQSLRSRNPDWGVRDLDEVALAAKARHFDLTEVIEMPANNLSVVFKRNG